MTAQETGDETSQAEGHAEDAGEKPGGAPPESRPGLTLQGLADKVDALARKVAGLDRAGRRQPAARGSDAVAAQVREEIGKMQRAEGKRAEESRIDQLAAQVKALAEKPPREYRPVTRWMWGDDE